MDGEHATLDLGSAGRSLPPGSPMAASATMAGSGTPALPVFEAADVAAPADVETPLRPRFWLIRAGAQRPVFAGSRWRSRLVLLTVAAAVALLLLWLALTVLGLVDAPHLHVHG
jgi:hypothetical protein